MTGHSLVLYGVVCMFWKRKKKKPVVEQATKAPGEVRDVKIPKRG